jgi:dTDP-L-rhamnose 4-epimerase
LLELPMYSHILITGGAGFIGSHLADELLAHGHRVRILDCLSAQVHANGRLRPDYLNEDVEPIWGDLRDPKTIERAVQDIDAVYHFAAAVGVGQSMYAIEDYTSHNDLGTAVLLEALIKHPVERLVVASSMSIYGEGLYRSGTEVVASGVERSMAQLRAGRWEPLNKDGAALEPIATPESKPPALSSVYALSKYDQERLCLMTGRAYNIPTVAMRFFNVYGTRQALSNPYTGVLAIFASRLLSNQPPLINEDGFQRRDFVSVYDVAQACRLALEVPEAAGHVFNVGSGHNYTIRDIAARIAPLLRREYLQPEITGKYRMGDIRHCFADISLARDILGYEPKIDLDDGLVELATWLEKQIVIDYVPQAYAELSARGLTV